MQEQLSSVDYDRAYPLQYTDAEPQSPSSALAFLRDFHTRFTSSLPPIDATTVLESITKSEFLFNEALLAFRETRLCVEGLIGADKARWNEFKAELEGYLKPERQPSSPVDDDIESTQSATDDENRLQAEENTKLQQLKETEELARQERVLAEQEIVEARQERERVRREKEDAERRRKDARQPAKEQRAAKVEEQHKAVERFAKEEQRGQAAAEASYHVLEVKREQQQITVDQGRMNIQGMVHTSQSSPAAESEPMHSRAIRAFPSTYKRESLSLPLSPDPDSSMSISESPRMSETAPRIQNFEIPARLSSIGERESMLTELT